MKFTLFVTHFENDIFVEIGTYFYNGIHHLYFGILTEKRLPDFLEGFELEAAVQTSDYDIYCIPNKLEIIEKIESSFEVQRERASELVIVSGNAAVHNPHIITIDECADLFCGKKVLLFTGAGISTRSGLPDMKSLEILIHDIFGNKEQFILDVLGGNITHRLTKINNLNKIFTISEPSKTHWLIAELVNNYGFDLVTGNIDGLHERTGILPNYYTDTANQVNDLEKFSFILTIGLGDEGILGLADQYRELNPDGRIIAINLEAPLYLESDDYFIKGDCEEELTLLLEKLKENQDFTPMLE